MNSKLYLVTGANGEVGTQVMEILLKEGRKVRALVRDAAKGEKFRERGAEIAVGNLIDESSLKKAMQGVYGVFHIGAVYREAGLPDEYYFDVNAEGTRRVFHAAIECGAKRVIHCSTGGVLGGITNPPGSHLTPYNPGDVYQRSKVEAEKIALDFYKSGTMRGVVIRPAMVYGPGDTRHLKLFRMIAKGKFFYVGKGDKLVHFIDIRDLARSFVLAMDNENLNGEIYHIAGSTPLPLKDAVNMIADYLKVSRPWLHLPVKLTQSIGTMCEILCKPFGISPPIYRRRVDFFTKSRCFDTTKAEKELGFRPTLQFEQELPSIIDWYKSRDAL